MGKFNSKCAKAVVQQATKTQNSFLFSNVKQNDYGMKRSQPRKKSTCFPKEKLFEQGKKSTYRDKVSESVQEYNMSRQTRQEQKCSTQAQSVGRSEYQRLKAHKRESVHSSKHTAYEDKPKLKRYLHNVASTQDNSFGGKMTRSSSHMQYHDERSKNVGASRLSKQSNGQASGTKSLCRSRSRVAKAMEED